MGTILGKLALISFPFSVLYLFFARQRLTLKLVVFSKIAPDIEPLLDYVFTVIKNAETGPNEVCDAGKMGPKTI